MAWLKRGQRQTAGANAVFTFEEIIAKRKFSRHIKTEGGVL
jgi:hypothetical protein